MLVLSSCSLDSNSEQADNIEYEIAEITGNDLPESFNFGERYTINVDYQLESDCSIYDGLYANYGGDSSQGRRQVYISAFAKVSTSSSCDDTAPGEEGTDSLNITISESGSYTFYFLTGEVAGEPIYDEVVVPVNEPGTGA